jgi:hypothetical protein
VNYFPGGEGVGKLTLLVLIRAVENTRESLTGTKIHPINGSGLEKTVPQGLNPDFLAFLSELKLRPPTAIHDIASRLSVLERMATEPENF